MGPETSVSFCNQLTRLCAREYFIEFSRESFKFYNIYIAEETGISTVPSKQIKVLGLSGKRQVGGLSSAERDVLVTAEIFMSASDNFVPTMLVFPLARENKELLDDAPPGSTAEYHLSGWMQTEIFLKWFHSFIAFSKPTERKLLLLRSESRAKSLELIELARKSHVVLLCFPSHTTHRLQPLDVSFMDPLKLHHSDGTRKWLQLHPGYCNHEASVQTVWCSVH
jgi:hypothetical protein